MTAEPRPKRFPPPEFPPRRAPAFSRTPPAVFPVLLGMCGLALALRVGLSDLGLPPAPADLVAGLVVALWAFGLLAYGLKLVRRPAVLFDDLKVMPARAGLSAASMGGMVAAALLAPFTAGLATGLLLAALALHAILALLVLRVLVSLPPEARAANPGWHLTFTGFIVAGPAAITLGHQDLALWLMYGTMPVAAAIWGISLVQLARRIPPAPLRPMLAIHLAPAALYAIVAAGTGQDTLTLAFLGLVAAILAALGLASRWILASGFSPLWGAFTFPLAAAATAFLLQEGELAWVGMALLAAALIAIPTIAGKVLRLWPGGKLAAKTNAAEA
ncbi:MAG TPA: tellurium resistance protein [Tabrizicola sp.]|nr:tellurium resistance protein [Tabrizicola sp.]